MPPDPALPSLRRGVAWGWVCRADVFRDELEDLVGDDEPERELVCGCWRTGGGNDVRRRETSSGEDVPGADLPAGVFSFFAPLSLPID